MRASAGSGSFRRKEKLEGYLEDARAVVARLKAELEADPAHARTSARSGQPSGGGSESTPRRGAGAATVDGGDQTAPRQKA